jgi:isoaspartyl peptidase/L-asparaginase-like protein (Ntn-hydrolase superfamily)
VLTEGFANPIYIAEKVLTSSSACMLASTGAKRFAEKHGFRTIPLSDLLAPEMVSAYHQWKEEKSKGITMNEAGGAGLLFYNIILQ